jgi:hypothetical protein
VKILGVFGFHPTNRGKEKIDGGQRMEKRGETVKNGGWIGGGLARTLVLAAAMREIGFDADTIFYRFGKGGIFAG